MAGVSFLDLMFAEALMAGLARDAQRRERPPPDNFFVLTRDPRAWMQIKEACKKENMVVCIEFINEGTSSSVFIDLAREFDSIPFLRVKIGSGLGGTYDELRRDLGGVQYTPTILVVYFGEDRTLRAKYEGLKEIQDGLRSGHLKETIKEFLERRVKMKLADSLAEQLADKVSRDISNKEEQMRREYEDKLRREMAEREDRSKKEEAEKKKQEEDAQRKRHQQRMRSEEIRRENRPQNLEELMKMDLDKAPIKEIKAIMIKMGISPHDCFERADLKKKLIDNVPELKFELERQSSSASMSSRGSTSSMSSVSSYGYDDTNSINTSFDDEIEDLKAENQRLQQQLGTKESQLTSKNGQLTAKDREIANLRSDMQKMTVRANQAERRVIELQGKAKAGAGGDPTKVRELESKMKDLERKLLETRMLYTTTIDDYTILGLIHDSGEEGLVLRAKCNKPALPNKERIYAMKVLTNYFQTQTQTQVRLEFKNEYDILCQLPPHENIIHMWAFFYDRSNPDISAHFKRAGRNARTMSLFMLMDELPMNMKDHVDLLVDSQGPKPEKVLYWFKELLSGLLFLEKHCVVHRDLKMENLLLNEDGKLVIGDFGKAVLLADDFKLPYVSAGADIGGNRAHLCPEILSARPGPRKYISYVKQPVWAAGVLGYELAGHQSPFAAGTIDQRGYTVDQLPALQYTHCKSSRYAQRLPREFNDLVHRMLDIEPSLRPTLAECYRTISSMVK